MAWTWVAMWVRTLTPRSFPSSPLYFSSNLVKSTNCTLQNFPFVGLSLARPPNGPSPTPTAVKEIGNCEASPSLSWSSLGSETPPSVT